MPSLSALNMKYISTQSRTYDSSTFYQMSLVPMLLSDNSGWDDINGLVQDYSDSIANTQELLQSRTKQTISLMW